MNIIETSELSKVYDVPARKGLSGLLRRDVRRVPALDRVSFNVSRGEIIGLIGPNGAGKSTLVKLLTGVLAPSSGVVSVLGMHPRNDRMKTAWRIGVVFGQRTQLWWDLPVRYSFDLLAGVYRIPSDQYRKRVAELQELLELGPFFERPVRTLSLGQRVRADIAASLLHEPEILFLDEPTIGLDLQAKQRIRAFLQRVNHERGMTVLLTSHDMVDIERLCARILVFDKGTVILDRPMHAVRDAYGKERVLVAELTAPPLHLDLSPAELVKVDRNRIWVRFQRDTTSASDLIARLARQAEIRDLTVEETGIERIVENIYARNHGAAPALNQTSTEHLPHGIGDRTNVALASEAAP